jgi:hypothetical protein
MVRVGLIRPRAFSVCALNPGPSQTMNSRSMIPVLFVVAALYDGVLGFAFLFAAPQVFAWLDIPSPNHLGYAQFPAALLIVFALMFVAVALKPRENRSLIPYGILLKVSYCGVVLFHWVTSDIPWIWKPFCIADVVFLVFFVLAWKNLGEKEA